MAFIYMTKPKVPSKAENQAMEPCFLMKLRGKHLLRRFQMSKLTYSFIPLLYTTYQRSLFIYFYDVAKSHSHREIEHLLGSCLTQVAALVELLMEGI